MAPSDPKCTDSFGTSDSTSLPPDVSVINRTLSPNDFLSPKNEQFFAETPPLCTFSSVLQNSVERTSNLSRIYLALTDEKDHIL
jgi:hypothetical protein